MTQTDVTNRAGTASLLMSFEEAAGMLPGTTALSLRKELKRSSELGRELLPFVVRISERRQYFNRSKFMAWLKAKAA